MHFHDLISVQQFVPDFHTKAVEETVIEVTDEKKDAESASSAEESSVKSECTFLPEVTGT
jgi:hypothetical protein